MPLLHHGRLHPGPRHPNLTEEFVHQLAGATARPSGEKNQPGEPGPLQTHGCGWFSAFPAVPSY